MAAERLKLFRPSSRSVKNSQYFDGIVADTIRDNVGSAGDDQLSGPDDSSRTAKRGKTTKLFHAALDVGFDPRCRPRIVSSNVFRFCDQVGDGRAQPSNAHGGSTW
jgi:hypothetical protein